MRGFYGPADKWDMKLNVKSVTTSVLDKSPQFLLNERKYKKSINTLN